jgi:uncharacterized membrane protein
MKLHPLDLLLRMSPLAFVQCVFYAYATGELERVREFSSTNMTISLASGLLINGLLAFALNIVSFTANKKTSALTMTVAGKNDDNDKHPKGMNQNADHSLCLGNVKQVLSIILAVVIFDLNINVTNAFGIALTLIGGAWYG